ncbi:MAG TPA: glycosyltransferase [Roseiflexaceae bacterium]|nr:glycosyltransferase [Roseiflexaceae bacterium]
MSGSSLNGARPAPRLSLTYIIGTYPGLTTTFIDREITALRRWGVDLQVLAIRRPPASAPLSQDQRALQQGVTYLLPIRWLALLASQLYFALRRPRRFFGTLAYLLTRPHPGMRARAMSVVHFGEGVYAAYLLRRRRFDELHAHFVDRAATVALVAGRLLGKPYSLSIHAGPDIFVRPVLLREKLLEARHVVTCTRYNKAHVERIAGQDLGHKISHVHHGLDLARYCPAPGAAEAPPLILSVGQLAARKGFAQLIRACARLRERGYTFSCRIVGNGPQRAELARLIDELALQEYVLLCGALSHEEVIEQYRRSTMFVLACVRSGDGDRDGFPNVLAEAMAMQLPVISTDVSAIPELLEDGRNGLLVPPGDHLALADAMAALLDDPALRARLAEQGRRTILERFDVERNVQRFASTLWPERFPG